MNDVPSIKNVWYENFEDELPIISELLEKYPYIAMVNTHIFKHSNIGYRVSWSGSRRCG